MQGDLRELFRKAAVRIDGRAHTVSFGRKDDVLKSALLKVLNKLDSRSNKLIGLSEVVSLSKLFLDGAGVYTDADGRAVLPRRIDNGINLFP